MDILVCIKQVPDTTKVTVDEKTGVLKREGVDSKLNPYDLYAIETAVRIKEMTGGNVIVISMGPPQAEAIIREAYMLGADEGYLISDRKFAGSDVLATSYTISQAIKSYIKFDMIICGKQTTDGDTAQVGPAVAEHLNIPQVSWVTELLNIEDDAITINSDLGDFVQTVKIKLPCLITVEKGIFQPRLPSYKRKLKTKHNKVKILSFDDLNDKTESRYGLKGSPTQVERIFPPDANSQRVIWEGDTEELCSKILTEMEQLKLL